MLGGLDLDDFVDKHCLAIADFEKNFRALKAKGRDSEKLPNEIRIDCIVVNCSPVKSAIETLIQNLYDALLNSLRRSIQRDINAVDAFLTNAMEVRPSL